MCSCILWQMEDNWWLNIAAKMQSAAVTKVKNFILLWRRHLVLKWRQLDYWEQKNGNELLTSMTENSKCWKHHFLELLNRYSQVHPKALDILEQWTVVEAMNNPPIHLRRSNCPSLYWMLVKQQVIIDCMLKFFIMGETTCIKLLLTSGMKVWSQMIGEMVFLSPCMRERVQKNCVVISVVILCCLLPVRSL